MRQLLFYGGRVQTMSVYWGRVKTESSYGGRVHTKLLWGPFSDPVGAELIPVLRFAHLQFQSD